jgi:hypothetical protein
VSKGYGASRPFGSKIGEIQSHTNIDMEYLARFEAAGCPKAKAKVRIDFVVVFSELQ